MKWALPSTKEGFTLIELLVVMTIIAILSGMVLSGVFAVQKAARRHQTQTVLAKVDIAIRQFRIETGFYPKGISAKAPIVYESIGYNRGLAKLDPASGIPIPDNDADWTSGSSMWSIGNGLYERLGVAMSEATKLQAVTNAEFMRKVEMERFYHIGNICDLAADSIGLGFTNTATWIGSSFGSPGKNWCYLDPVGAATLGEKELRRVFDHYRAGPGHMTGKKRGIPAPPWVGPWSWVATTTRDVASTWGDMSGFASGMLNGFLDYTVYARPRDASDAYRRALRDGVLPGNVNFDSQYDANHVAQATGAGLLNRTIAITVENKPWSSGYLVDLESRYIKDIDGDGNRDILEGYRRPLIYLNEGMPAAKRIRPQSVSIESSKALQYHPDPNLDLDGHMLNANTAQQFVTDKANSKGVLVRADAYDISMIVQPGPYYGGDYYLKAVAQNGINIQICGSPYQLEGTLIPSRMRINSVPNATRGGETYFCLSKDGTTIVEPFADTNGDGEWNPGERYIDRTRFGNVAKPYNSTVALNDMRLCAPSGDEREYELWSAGVDGRFSALRTQAVNSDNIAPDSRK